MSQTETEITPFKEQEPFLWSDHKYYGYISGVGAGKTSGGIIRTVLNMEHWNPGELGAIVAPTTTMIKDVIIPEMREFGLLNHWEYRSQHSDEPGIHAPNGSRALILSADNRRTVERLRGLNLAWWWIDERTEVPQRAQEILQQRLRVGNYRNGYITTTPKGYDSVYDFFVGGIEGTMFRHGQADVLESTDRLSILRVPSHANPFTPDDYKEQLDADFSGESYEQEVLGDFTTFEGLVHKWFDRDEHIKSFGWMQDKITREERGKIIPDFDRIIYGQDWGFSSDPAGALAIVVNGEDYYIIDEFKERGLTNQELAKQIQGWYDNHDSGPVYCDPAEPGSIEVFHRNGIDALKADNSVSEGLQAVKTVSDNIHVAEHCTSLINEFGQYRYKDDPKDDSDVVKAHDHLMDALRYSIIMDRRQGQANVGVMGGETW